MSDTDETPQIPTDAPAPPDASERVDIVAPEPEPPRTDFSPPPAAEAAGSDFVSQHPEALVAGAFAGAFVFAKLLQRIGGHR